MKLTDFAKSQIAQKIAFLEEHCQRVIIDADTHLTDCGNLHPSVRERYHSTPDYYHGRPVGAEDLLAEMDIAGVDMALCWQNPAATVYPGDEAANFAALLEANTYIAEVAAKYPTRLIPGGWTDPGGCGVEGAMEMAERCVREFGMPFVKMNPAQNGYPIDSDAVVAVLRHIVSMGAFPAFHYGADTPFTPPEGLEKLARLIPEVPLIAVHMGGGGAAYVDADATYLKTRELGLRYPNLFFILSAKRDTHMASDLIVYQRAGAPFQHNIACASDAPYGNVNWNFGGFHALFKALRDGRYPDPRIASNEVVFEDADVQNYMGGNFARLALKAYHSIL